MYVYVCVYVAVVFCVVLVLLGQSLDQLRSLCFLYPHIASLAPTHTRTYTHAHVRAHARAHTHTRRFSSEVRIDPPRVCVVSPSKVSWRERERERERERKCVGVCGWLGVYWCVSECVCQCVCVIYSSRIFCQKSPIFQPYFFRKSARFDQKSPIFRCCVTPEGRTETLLLFATQDPLMIYYVNRKETCEARSLLTEYRALYIEYVGSSLACNTGPCDDILRQQKRDLWGTVSFPKTTWTEACIDLSVFMSDTASICMPYGTNLCAIPMRTLCICFYAVLWYMSFYGVPTISRLLKFTDRLCRISSLVQGSFAKETYNLRSLRIVVTP